MPHDPARLADTKAWLLKATQDLRVAAHDLTANPPLAFDVVFHAQQTVEKILKAFLTWHDQPFRKTHSLEELGEACLKLDPTLRSLVDRVTPLTEYAWRFRYPGEPDEPSSEEAVEALITAQAVSDAILARLPHETHPSASGD